jgi:transposase-like protein
MVEAFLGGEVRNVSVLVAIGVNQDGYREILGVAEGSKEDKASWQQFLRYLKQRGLKGVRLVVSDKCLGLVEAIESFSLKPPGNAVLCIFIVMYGLQCPLVKSPR